MCRRSRRSSFVLLKVVLASNRAEHSGFGMVRRSGVPLWPGWAQSSVVPALLRSSTPSGDGSKALWLIPARTNDCSFNWPEMVICTHGASGCAWAPVVGRSSPLVPSHHGQWEWDWLWGYPVLSLCWIFSWACCSCQPMEVESLHWVASVLAGFWIEARAVVCQLLMLCIFSFLVVCCCLCSLLASQSSFLVKASLFQSKS